MGLDEYRPAIDLPEIGQSLLQRWEIQLLTAANVAHDVPIAYRVVRQLTPQSDIDDRRVEPELTLPLDARIQIKRQRDPIAQGIPDAGVHRVLHPRVQQEHPLVDIDVRRADFEDAIEGARERERAAGCQQESEETLQPTLPQPVKRLAVAGRSGAE